MNNKKMIKEYLKTNYYNKDNNYETILNKINNEKNINRFKILKFVATFIITILGTTGIVLATTQIYNIIIKKKDSINSEELFLIKDGIYAGLHSDEITNDMIYDEETRLYYKVITDEPTYNEYKNKVTELPENSEIDFNNEFFLIITGTGTEISIHKRDLTISEINTDDTITYISLIPKENPDYNKTHSTLYVIADKTLLKNEIKINIDTSVFKIQNITPINELPKDYSKEDAIRDGCMVIERDLNEKYLYKVLSENEYALDELIEKSEKGIESHIRVYWNEYTPQVKILDIQYKNGIFIIDSGYLGDTNISTHSCKYITKTSWENNTYVYGCNNINKNPLYSMMLLFVTIN